MPPRKRQRVEKPRSHPDVDVSVTTKELDDAEFAVNILQSRSQQSKKRKRDAPPGQFYQDFSFYSDALSTYYTISVNKDKKVWTALKKYNRFQIEANSNDKAIHMGQVIYVKQDQEDAPQANGTSDESEDAHANDWIAKILECRAIDEQHVYLLISWLYRPEDTAEGRQPHHGRDEVIATNDLQVIDAMTVNGLVDALQYLNEEDDGALNEGYDSLVWRQTYDVRSRRYSKLRTYCTCKGFANPDVPLVHCDKCLQWMHPSCIVSAAEQGTSTANAIVLPDRSGAQDPHVKAASHEPEPKGAIDSTQSKAISSQSDSPNDVEKPDETSSRQYFKGAFVSLLSSFGRGGESKAIESEPNSPSQTAPVAATTTPPPADDKNATQLKTKSEPPSSPAKSPGLGQVKRTARLIGLGGDGDAGPLRLEITSIPVGKRGKKAPEPTKQTWEEAVRCLLCGAQVE